MGLLRTFNFHPKRIQDKFVVLISFIPKPALSECKPPASSIKDKKDLRKKLDEGIKDSENGKVCSIDEAFLEIEQILAE